MLKEGNFYELFFLRVVQNEGDTRVIFHRFRLIFQVGTEVLSVAPNGVPSNVLSIVDSQQVLSVTENYNALVGEC